MMPVPDGRRTYMRNQTTGDFAFASCELFLSQFRFFRGAGHRAHRHPQPTLRPGLRQLIQGTFAIALLLSATESALAQGAPGLRFARANAGTVGIISGGA